MDIKDMLANHHKKDLIRFSTMGSVDDGKSTLIGRLLHDSKAIYEDHLIKVKQYTEQSTSGREDLELAFLLDGLKAEREQGITIDVAYRYFSTPGRKFIIADTPGHEQYTRNMATGASTANLAIIIIDAAKGVLPQSKRHSFIAGLLGIKHLVVAINKMDLVNYSQSVFERIKEEFTSFVAKLEVSDVHFIPISALHGDNVVDKSEAMPWFKGSPLLNYLESVHIASDRNLIDLRFPVQYVLRSGQDFRGYCGTIASGIVRPGDEVVVLPSGLRTEVTSIVTHDGDLERAFPPQAVTLTLKDDIDVSRGDMLCHVHNVPTMSRDIEAMIVWMAEEPMITGKPYLIKHTTRTLTGHITELLYRMNINTLHRENASQLKLNEIGRAVLTLNQPLLFDIYARNRTTGSIIIIDRFTNTTVGAGTIIDRTGSKIEHSDRQPRTGEKRVPSATPLAGSEPDSSTADSMSRITSEQREHRKGHRGVVIWLSDPDSATIAPELENYLFHRGGDVYVIDEMALQQGLNRDLGTSPESQLEKIRRATELAKLFTDAGLIVIVPCPALPDRAPGLIHEVYPDEMCGKISIQLAAPEIDGQPPQATVLDTATDDTPKTLVNVSISQDKKAGYEVPSGLDRASREKCIEAILDCLEKTGVFG